MHRSAFAVALGLLVFPATATAAGPAAQSRAAWERVGPATYELDQDALADVLRGAPAESQRPVSTLTISVPAPDGGFERFAVVESPIMEPGLAAAHPELKTYTARGLDDPSASARLDLTPVGFHASVRSASGAWYVDPRGGEHVAYRREATAAPPFHEPGGGLARALAPRAVATGGDPVTLRVYRLALLSDPDLRGGDPGHDDGGQGRAGQPAQPGLRAGPRGTPAAGRGQRPAQPRHGRGRDRDERPVRRGRLLHRAAAAGLRERDARPHQRRRGADPGRRELRPRPPGHGRARRWARGPGRGRHGLQGRRLHGDPEPGGGRLHVDFVAHEVGHQFGAEHTFNSRVCAGNIAADAGGARRARERHVDHGLRGHVRGRQPAGSLRPVLLAGLDRADQRARAQRRGARSRRSSRSPSTVRRRRQLRDQLQRREFGTAHRGGNYTANGIEAAIEGIAGWPAGATVAVPAQVSRAGFTVYFFGLAAPARLAIVSPAGFGGGFAGVTAVAGTTRYGGAAQATANRTPSVALAARPPTRSRRAPRSCWTRPARTSTAT